MLGDTCPESTTPEAVFSPLGLPGGRARSGRRWDNHSVHVTERPVGPESEQRQGEILLRPDPRAQR